MAYTDMEKERAYIRRRATSEEFRAYKREWKKRPENQEKRRVKAREATARKRAEKVAAGLKVIEIYKPTDTCSKCGVTWADAGSFSRGMCRRCYRINVTRLRPEYRAKKREWRAAMRRRLGCVQRVPVDRDAKCSDCDRVRGDSRRWTRGRCWTCHTKMMYRTDEAFRKRALRLSRRCSGYGEVGTMDSSQLYVYLIAQDDWTAMKVGISRSPKGRLKALQSANPRPLQIVATMAGDATDEAFIHGKLDRFRLCGEWFEVTSESMRIVAESFGRPDLVADCHSGKS